MSHMMALCKKIIKYHEEGTPVKDAVEPSQWSTDELVVELAYQYVASNRPSRSAL